MTEATDEQRRQFHEALADLGLAKWIWASDDEPLQHFTVQHDLAVNEVIVYCHSDETKDEQ